jgi:glutathione S-transferase
MIRVTAFRWVPPFAQGLVRDLRVRWALEEAGLPYEERLIGFEDQSKPEYRALQPFGQVPVYEEISEGAEPLVLFESGAIVLHIAERSPVLLPADPAARAMVIQWMFAALNSIEQHVQGYAMTVGFYAKEEWAKLRAPSAREMADKRLDDLAARLGDSAWLEGDFSAADLLMASVLRIGRDTDLISSRPTLDAYLKRCEERPAFRKALADQLAAFTANAPPAQSA